MAFVNVAMDVGFDGGCSSVIWTLTALWVTKVYSLNFNTSRLFHKLTSGQRGDTVVTPRVVLSEKGS